MYEFHWKLPGRDGSHDVRLLIHARRSWVGRKTLLLDGRTVYRRNWFGGINHEFGHPTNPNQTIEVRAVPDRGRRLWMPELSCQGEPIAEQTGCEPPPVPDRPKLLAVVTGLTYLVMLMMLIMLPHIWRMLYTGFGHSDSRTYVLEVAGPVEPADVVEGLRLGRGPLPPAREGEAYEASITVEGGLAPYRWERIKGKFPPRLVLDKETGSIRGTPVDPGDSLIQVLVTDASGIQAEWPYVVSVLPAHPIEPRIVTRTLPVARVGEAYATTLEAVGGEPFVKGNMPTYDWVINKRKLPKGLEFNKNTGRLEGVPAAGSVGAFPFTARVFDSAYSPFEHISPWIAPFAVTAFCLLGFWNMLRWSVVLYGALIVGQLVLGLFGGWIGLILQGAILGVGAAGWRRMR